MISINGVFPGVNFTSSDSEVVSVLLPTENGLTSIHHIDLRRDGSKIADSKGNTWLHILCAQGELEYVKKIVQYGGKSFDLNVKNGEEKTPLTVAIRENKQEVVEFLIQEGADVNASSSKGWTSLHAAALAQNIDAVKLLLAHDAQITKTGKTLYSRITPSARTGTCSGATSLILGAEKGSEELIYTLLKAGDDPHAVVSDGTNVLHYVIGGNPTVLRYFLELRVNPNQATEEGNTPLHTEIQMSLHREDKSKSTESIKLLVEYGADVNLPDQHGNLPLHEVVKDGRVALVKLFLEHRANVNAVDGKKQTPLYLACSSEDANVEIIRMLFEHGANPNTQHEVPRLFKPDVVTPFECFAEKLPNSKIPDAQVLPLTKLFVKKGATLNVRVEIAFGKYLEKHPTNQELAKYVKEHAACTIL